MKPVIGIYTVIGVVSGGDLPGMERIYVNSDYVDAVKKAGGIPLLIPPIVEEEDINKFGELCDGFIISGGADINPITYNEEPSPKLNFINNRMDEYQLKLTKHILKIDKPLLGICRGHQLINVITGGTLHQDLSLNREETIKHVQESRREDYCHSIEIDKESILFELLGEKLFVNSYHHQAINKLGKGLKVIAKAKDEVIEAIRMEDKKFVIGVQWHPEMMLAGSEDMLPLFKKLIAVSMPML